ncbi:MAG: alpha/beta hydrolase [Salaquimonas sp.]|nr:alpha/beta hydrolase [Salaquimonas sp.]
MPHIPGGETYPEQWTQKATQFRETMVSAGRAEIDLSYGPGERNCWDLFLPESNPRGLFVFIHGGYWMRFDKSSWSYVAAGPLAHGFAVAMPSYSLCPQVRIRDITREIGAAIEAVAARIAGPILLAGHSAGGHLVSRMLCADTPLSSSTLGRIANTVSISGVHDLRPLVPLELNATLHLDAEEAAAESPALLEPAGEVNLVCWAGAAERSEFVRQNALLANIWRGLRANTLCVEEPDRHHFSVVEGLANPESPLMTTLMD